MFTQMRFNLKLIGTIIFSVVFLAGGFFISNVAKAGVSEITKLIIVSNQQTINVGEKSVVMDVQMKTLGDVATSTGVSSTHLIFNSTSSTGIFWDSNSSTCNSTEHGQNGYALGVNSNWTQKYFCYQDTTPGIYTITVTSQEYPTWTPATQTITITTTPNLDSATITSDGVSIGTLNSATLRNGNTTGMHTLSVSDVSISNGPLASGEYAFTLTTPTNAQILKDYFAAKAGWTDEMKTQIDTEIDGHSPFFYFKVDGTNYSLVDGFKKTTHLDSLYGSNLTIDDNYPTGNYTYTGTIGFQSVSITLTVANAPKLSGISISGGDSGITVTGDLDSGFTVKTNGDTNLHNLNLATGASSDKKLTADNSANYIPFKLTHIIAGLADYFISKGIPSDTATKMANGTNATFYLKVLNTSGVTTISLVDGFLHDNYLPEATLRINGDYPEATYQYSGRLTEVGNPNNYNIQNLTTIVQRQEQGGGDHGPNYTTIFGGVKTALASGGINTNMDTCASTPTACSNLYFEKVGYGKIAFNTALDLTDDATQTYLSTLGSKLDMATAGKISLDAVGSALAGKSATIKFYNTNDLGIPDSATPSQIANYIVVKNNLGEIIPNSDHTNYPEISGFQYVGACGVFDTVCHYFSFTVGHFTTFELDVPDTTPPATPIITTPSQFTRNENITIEGTAEVGSSIKITGGMGTISRTATGGVYNISIDLIPNTINTLLVTATDRAGNESNAATVTITQDAIAPTVILSDDHPDSFVKQGDIITFTATFTETNSIDEENNAPKLSISNSLLNNALMTKVSNKIWTYIWTVPNGNEGSHSLSVKAYDEVGNTNDTTTGKTSYTIIILTNNQTTPDEQGDVTLNDTKSEVVITDPNKEITVETGSTPNASLDVTAFTPNGSGERIVPAIIINSDVAQVVIPDDTKITATGWNGTMILPRPDTSTTSVAPAGFSVGNVKIEMGSPDMTLVFDKAVKITLTNVTGDVGYRPAGSNNWQTITTECLSATDHSNISSGECYFHEGNDTIIWTYHFTTFGSLDVTRGSSGGMILTVKGDINKDKKVDKYDFALMMSNWSKTGINNSDLNNDNKVDKYDFALLMLNWSK